MSRVTNVIITTESCDDCNLQLLNEAVKRMPGYTAGTEFQDLDALSGGDKHLECNIYVGAFNHLSVRSFCEAVASVLWNHPETVQVFIKEEEAEGFVELRASDFRRLFAKG